jgi:hypothetical protein
MATAARILANQANAQLSTGPRTPEGKARSSQNSRSHGLFSAVDSFTPLDREAYEGFLHHFTLAWGPASAVSRRVVEQIALAHFRLERVRALQASHLARQVQALCEAEGLPAPASLPEQADLEARVHFADAQGPKLLDRFHRYEQSFLREIRRLEASLMLILQSESRRSEPPPPALPAKSALQNEPIPRSAPCPCGSGLKFKRCCGPQAPPVPGSRRMSYQKPDKLERNAESS